MHWIHLLAASLVNIVILIPIVILVANLGHQDDADIKEAERARTVIAISATVFAAMLLAGFKYWQFIYSLDPHLIVMYTAMVASAYVICIAILAMRGHLGYLQGNQDEPEWVDIFAAVFWSFFGPLVLIGLAVEIYNQWKYRSKK